jgi:hypothetical protein
MTAFGTYLNDIQKSLARGDATEHTHRPALQALLQSAAKGITATNEPKHIPIIGAPDFKVSRGKIPLGHVETKDVGTDLAEMEKGKGSKLDKLFTEFPQRGDCVVEKVQYTDNDQRVWINPNQYFGGVPKAVWEFHVGGYQVCEKWLKDRKGRVLMHDDIEHYQRTVSALAETRSLMAQIDALIADHGGWPLS